MELIKIPPLNLKNLKKQINIQTIDNAYVLEFREMRGDSETGPESEQHHTKSYQTIEDLESDLAAMTSLIQVPSKDIIKLN